MNILLVDDEPPALRLLTRTVGAVLPGAKLHGFASAEEAMDFARQELIDIAFLDIRMQSMDGIEMAEKLCAMYPKINIIFCTGHSEYALDAHQVYCSAYLMKPVIAEEVAEAISHLRFPVEENDSPVFIRCAGEFEAFCNGEPIRFKYKKTKEILACLVSRNGEDCPTNWIAETLFGDEDHPSYLKQLRKDMIDTFAALGMDSVITAGKGVLRINRDAVRSDYFEYRDGRRACMPEGFQAGSDDSGMA